MNRGIPWDPIPMEIGIMASVLIGMGRELE